MDRGHSSSRDFSLAEEIIAFLQTGYFVSCLRDCVHGVEYHAGNKWDIFWKAYIVLNVIIFIYLCLLVFPLVSVRIVSIMKISVIPAFVPTIWRLVLTWQTGSELATLAAKLRYPDKTKEKYD